MVKPVGKPTDVRRGKPRRATAMRVMAAERPTSKRVGRVGGAAGGSTSGATDETALLRTRLAELESKNVHLADRLAWAIDRIGSIIEELKGARAR